MNYDTAQMLGTINLDWRVCSRARMARDPRFDGKFFIGVFTTGIYCRPICRTRTSQESNVCYFPTAAAAAEAGFRPCLRCRPEGSPGAAAFAGTQNTVSRALRLIGESGLEDGGVETLAQHLGVGSRHLRRLFLRHLGATPSAVAQTRRLHFAKKLIDETSLLMTEIAIASGFGCVRRFNAAIRRVYQRTPTQIRRLARQKNIQPQNQYLFQLHFRPPYDWQGMLDFLAARATPGVEVVEANKYRRSFSLHGNPGYFEVAMDEANHAVIARVEIGDSRLLFAVIERIRAMFDLNADCGVIARTLRTSPLLAQWVEEHPGLRVPGCWDGFELATRAILGQQISVQRATAIAGRLASAFGRPFCPADKITHLFPSPEVLADADLSGQGLTGTRANSVRALARAVCDGQISFERIADTNAFLARLSQIRGIGEWTAQYVAMRALGQPDAFPSDDLGLVRAAGLKNSREMEQRSLAWRPWRAYAAVYLWTMQASMHGERGTRDGQPTPSPPETRGLRASRAWPSSPGADPGHHTPLSKSVVLPRRGFSGTIVR
jgi:AraC family transcriptional regulator, regulatory protein of adaptative response / DNA-3-methyladenine glycosylase II